MSITAPTDISGCKLWLQGDLGLYDAVSGGSLVATDGAAAKRWEDQSGQGNHWTEATNPPARRDSGVNGARSVRFNGTNQLLSRTHAASASLVTLQGGSYTFVWALAFTSLSQDYASWFSKADNGNASRLWFLNRSGVNQCVAERFMPTGTSGIKAWAAGHGQSGRAVVGTPYVVSYTFDLTGTDTGTETFRINGVTVARRTGVVPSVDGATDFRLGACSVGGTVAFWFPGDLAMVLAYDSALSAGDLADAEDYARSYCGMSAFPAYAAGKRMVNVGDSLTEGYNATTPTNAWPAKLTESIGHNYPVVNSGSAGIPISDIVADVASRVYPAVDAGLAAGDEVTVTVYAGTNDLAVPGQAGAVISNTAALCTGIRARGAGVKVAVFTLTPRQVPGGNAGFEADRQTVASSVRANHGTYSDGMVDLAADAAMGQAGDETDGTYYSSDELHYNDGGHARVAADARPVVGPWLAPIVSRRGRGNRPGSRTAA